jgi:hypothetical protein
MSVTHYFDCISHACCFSVFPVLGFRWLCPVLAVKGFFTCIIIIIIIIIIVTPWSSVFLETLTLPQLFKKFTAFCGTLKFITAFATAPPSRVPIMSQINPVHARIPLLEDQFLILFSHLRLGLSSSHFPSGFSHQKPVCTSPVRHTCYLCRLSHSSWLDRPIIFGEEYGS